MTDKLPDELPDGNAPEGRKTVVGVIKGFKKYENKFEGGFVTKMLVELENGSKVFCTVPATIGTAQKEDLVKITATWERKEPTFAFGSRPRAEFLKL